MCILTQFRLHRTRLERRDMTNGLLLMGLNDGIIFISPLQNILLASHFFYCDWEKIHTLRKGWEPNQASWMILDCFRFVNVTPSGCNVTFGKPFSNIIFIFAITCWWPRNYSLLLSGIQVLFLNYSVFQKEKVKRCDLTEVKSQALIRQAHSTCPQKQHLYSSVCHVHLQGLTWSSTGDGDSREI